MAAPPLFPPPICPVSGLPILPPPTPAQTLALFRAAIAVAPVRVIDADGCETVCASPTRALGIPDGLDPAERELALHNNAHDPNIDALVAAGCLTTISLGAGGRAVCARTGHALLAVVRDADTRLAVYEADEARLREKLLGLAAINHVLATPLVRITADDGDGETEAARG